MEKRIAALNGVVEVGFAEDVEDGGLSGADGGVARLALEEGLFAEDPRMRVEGLRIVAKSGGKSGSVTFE